MNLRYIKQARTIRPNNIDIELNYNTKYKLYELYDDKIIYIIDEFNKRLIVPLQPKTYIEFLKIIISVLKQELLWRKYNNSFIGKIKK